MVNMKKKIRRRHWRRASEGIMSNRIFWNTLGAIILLVALWGEKEAAYKAEKEAAYKAEKEAADKAKKEAADKAKKKADKADK